MVKQKRKTQRRKDGSLKVVFINTMMAVTALIAALVLLLISMGYKFGLDGTLGRTGLVQINSLPSGAEVEVDGKPQSMRTDFSKSFDAGWHNFAVSQEGFDIWRKAVEVKPGLVTRLNYVRLFPLARNAEFVRAEESLYRVFMASGRQTILSMKTQAEWELIDIRNDQTRYTPVALDSLFAEGVLLAAKDITVTAWSDNGQRALVRVTRGDDVVEWVVIDAGQVSRSVNLNKELSLEFTDVVFADGSGTKAYVLERGNLRQVDINAKIISAVVQPKVSAIHGFSGRVMYARTDDTGARLIEVWRDGANGPMRVGKIPAETQGEIALVQAEFRGRSWVAYRLGGQVRVFEGMVDKVGTNESMEVTMEQAFASCDGGLSAAGQGRLIKLRCDDKTLMLDLEEDALYTVDETAAVARWLDDYLLYLQDGVDTYAIDFDGANGRWLLPVSDFPVVASVDNRWMYYYDTTDEGEIELLRWRLDG